MRGRLWLVLAMGCGEPDRLSVIPDEPDTGVVQTTYPDAQSEDILDLPDAGFTADAGCDAAQHQPYACRAGGCYGAVLCLGGALRCVAPECSYEPDPDACELADYVFIVDRSGSMLYAMPHVMTVTSSLASKPGRNVFMVDVPGFYRAQPERPAPNRWCYGDVEFPIGPCEDVEGAISDFWPIMWGGDEYTYDALAELPNSIRWTPGASRHAFVFADERGQGMFHTELSAYARLAASGIKVHVWTNYRQDYDDIVDVTGGTLHDLGAPTHDPCP